MDLLYNYLMKKLLGIVVLSFLWCNISFAKIIIPTHNWTSQIVGAYVIGGIFEEMGYSVKYKNADSQAVYKSIRKGDVSISHEVWESAFGKSFNNALSKGGIVDAGEHIARSMEDMGVPNWVIKKNLCPGLPDWTALKNPDCAKNFITPDSGGKGRMLEGPQTWQGDLIPQRIDALGLGDLWTVKFAGSADALWAELAKAKRENRGTIIFNWSPNFTDREGFTMINFPPYYNGCRPEDGGDGACGSPNGYIKKAASIKFVNNYPGAFEAFKKIEFSTKDFGTMAALVDIDKMSHKAAAKKWLRENRNKWESWIGKSNIAEKPKKKKKTKVTPDDNKIVPAGSGSGFFVSKEGHAITNYHVIQGCDINKLTFKGSQSEVKVLAVDKVNDIAILKSNEKPDVIFPVSNEDVSLLEDVIVAGFPLGKQISSAIKTHKGVVTALAGAGDNYSFFQTDAAINQGNSGGPIINQKGNVVGIAVATWVEEGVQGVHFGIKSSTLKTFASANDLSFASPNFRELSNKDLGKLVTKGTVYIECHMTVAKIKKMLAQAENRKAFFKEHR